MSAIGQHQHRTEPTPASQSREAGASEEYAMTVSEPSETVTSSERAALDQLGRRAAVGLRIAR